LEGIRATCDKSTSVEIFAGHYSGCSDGERRQLRNFEPVISTVAIATPLLTGAYPTAGIGTGEVSLYQLLPGTFGRHGRDPIAQKRSLSDGRLRRKKRLRESSACESKKAQRAKVS
jgi:hypothetical protein